MILPESFEILPAFLDLHYDAILTSRIRGRLIAGRSCNADAVFTVFRCQSSSPSFGMPRSVHCMRICGISSKENAQRPDQSNSETWPAIWTSWPHETCADHALSTRGLDTAADCTPADCKSNPHTCQRNRRGNKSGEWEGKLCFYGKHKSQGEHQGVLHQACHMSIALTLSAVAPKSTHLQTMSLRERLRYNYMNIRSVPLRFDTLGKAVKPREPCRISTS